MNYDEVKICDKSSILLHLDELQSKCGTNWRGCLLFERCMLTILKSMSCSTHQSFGSLLRFCKEMEYRCKNRVCTILRWMSTFGTTLFILHHSLNSLCHLSPLSCRFFKSFSGIASRDTPVSSLETIDAFSSVLSKWSHSAWMMLRDSGEDNAWLTVFTLSGFLF